MSRTTRHPWAPNNRPRVERQARDLRPSVQRGLQSADSSEDDVPAPEEIDPSLLNRFDCDHDSDFAHNLDECLDDGQPYCDAP